MLQKVLNGFTIAVIDDEIHNRTVIRRLLEGLGGTVTAFDGAEEALIWIQNNIQHTVLDFIVTDILMPEMDGWEFLQVMRSDQHTQTIPIIALTAMSNFDELNTTFPYQFDLCIRKPIIVAEFIPEFIQMIQSIPSVKTKIQAR